MDNKLVMALIIIVVLDVIFFLSHTAMIKINPTGATLQDYNNTVISEFDAGGHTLLSPTSTTGLLPEATESVSTEGDNTFTDTFKTSTNWLKSLEKGANYLITITAGPVNYLKNINAPNEIVFSLGALWYIITFILIVAFILNR